MAGEQAASEAESGPRARRREERRALSRDQILDAAEQIFAEHGFHEASLREIAERAEFSVGGIYTFFSTKDELYRECMHRRGAEFMAGMTAAAQAPGSPLHQLHEVADWQVGFFRRHPHFARLVIRDGAVGPLAAPEQDDEFLDNFRTAQALQANLITAGQAAAEIRAGSPTVLARLFSGLVSAYQTTQLETDGSEGNATPVSLLHDVLDGAFARTATGTLS